MKKYKDQKQETPEENRKQKIKALVYMTTIAASTLMISNNAYAVDLDAVKTSMIIPVVKLVDDIAPMAAFGSGIFGAIAAKSQSGGAQAAIGLGVGLVFFAVIRGGTKVILGLEGVI